jgi:hypothetical protein
MPGMRHQCNMRWAVSLQGARRRAGSLARHKVTGCLSARRKATGCLFTRRLYFFHFRR